MRHESIGVDRESARELNRVGEFEVQGCTQARGFFGNRQIESTRSARLRPERRPRSSCTLRHMASLAEIERYAERIAREFRPERIILFGSHALGSARDDSDVDLLVVMAHSGKSWDQAAEIRSRLRPNFPLDLLVRSPEKLDERLELGDPLFIEIATTGRVLHEANHD